MILFLCGEPFSCTFGGGPSDVIICKCPQALYFSHPPSHGSRSATGITHAGFYVRTSTCCERGVGRRQVLGSKLVRGLALALAICVSSSHSADRFLLSSHHSDQLEESYQSFIYPCIYSSLAVSLLHTCHSLIECLAEPIGAESVVFLSSLLYIRNDHARPYCQVLGEESIGTGDIIREYGKISPFPSIIRDVSATLFSCRFDDDCSKSCRSVLISLSIFPPHINSPHR